MVAGSITRHPDLPITFVRDPRLLHGDLTVGVLVPLKCGGRRLRNPVAFKLFATVLPPLRKARYYHVLARARTTCRNVFLTFGEPLSSLLLYIGTLLKPSLSDLSQIVNMPFHKRPSIMESSLACINS
jgi:hypothetical protein